jgi:hypothetical protein
VSIACTSEFLYTELSLVQLLNIVNSLLPTDLFYLLDGAFPVILILYVWELPLSLSDYCLIRVLRDFEDVFYEVPVAVDESDSKEPFLLCL